MSDHLHTELVRKAVRITDRFKPFILVNALCWGQCLCKVRLYRRMAGKQLLAKHSCLRQKGGRKPTSFYVLVHQDENIDSSGNSEPNLQNPWDVFLQHPWFSGGLHVLVDPSLS